MSTRKRISLAVLLCLCAVLGRIGYTRAVGLVPGVSPEPLAGGFNTEEAWVVDEIVRDITEMSALATRQQRVDPRIRPIEGRRHSFSIENNGAPPVVVDLDAAMWSPQAFSLYAAARLAKGARPAPAKELAGVRETLVEMTSPALVRGSAAASEALQHDMQDVAAHDAAALTLAAFALRESAGRLSDTRWAMNRMTAHLAIADALSGSDHPTLDHKLASAVLLVLTGDQVAALRTLDELDGDANAAGVSEWRRAIRIRIDDDWRILNDPRHASRIEQREYVRARAVTVQGSTGAATLEGLGVEADADMIALIVNGPTGVVDGWLSTHALELEQPEYELVYGALRGSGTASRIAAALNEPTTRCVIDGRVDVLPWGAWAEYFQRHIAAAIAKQDSFVRNTLGAHERADEQKLALHESFGHLWSFPMATMYWTRGRNGTEGDSTYLANAVALLLSSPRRIPSGVWSRIDLGTKYEPVRGVPTPTSWFIAPEPRSGYEAAVRFRDAGYPRAVATLDQMLAKAPYDWALASTYLMERYGNKTPLAEVERVAGRRVEYDLRLVDRVNQLVTDTQRTVDLERRACGLTASRCTTLGVHFAMLGRDQEAVEAFEMAFADPEVDPVARANQSGWLVRYYAGHRRVTAALALAEEGARTASFTGLATAGRLYEALGRLHDAEKTFTEGAEHYDNWAELTAFYYRRAEVHKDARYLPDWRRFLARVFPEGLNDEPAPDARPSAGVQVEKGTSTLRSGDVIVAVDGWRVANLAQYRAVRAFPTEGRILLTVWRGTRNVEVTIANRDLVPYFTVVDYPPKGWIE